MTMEAPTSWLDAQSAEVRAELDNLLAYKPEAEFIQTLADLLPVLPCAGLVDLYYDIFYCCKPALNVAVRHLHDPAELSRFLLLAERALVDQADFDTFTSTWSDDDDIDEIIFWLKRHASAKGGIGHPVQWS
jgi:hypothetical protein